MTDFDHHTSLLGEVPTPPRLLHVVPNMNPTLMRHDFRAGQGALIVAWEYYDKTHPEAAGRTPGDFVPCVPRDGLGRVSWTDYAVVDVDGKQWRTWDGVEGDNLSTFHDHVDRLRKDAQAQETSEHQESVRLYRLRG